MKLENNPGKTGIVSMLLIKLLMKDIDGIPGPIRTHSYLDNVTWAFRRLFVQELLHTDNNNNNKTLLASRRWVCRECELNIYIYVYIYIYIWAKYANRKYEDYVYRNMLVQEYLKKLRIFKKVKPKNDLMYQDLYNSICQNTQKIRFIIHYVKPTAQLLFKIRFSKGGPTCRRQVVNPRHQTPQGQSTPLQNIQVE